jgi:hypothetical protein
MTSSWAGHTGSEPVTGGAPAPPPAETAGVSILAPFDPWRQNRTSYRGLCFSAKND